MKVTLLTEFRNSDTSKGFRIIVILGLGSIWQSGYGQDLEFTDWGLNGDERAVEELAGKLEKNIPS